MLDLRFSDFRIHRKNNYVESQSMVLQFCFLQIFLIFCSGGYFDGADSLAKSFLNHNVKLAQTNIPHSVETVIRYGY